MAEARRPAHYGAWESPISAATIAEKGIAIEQILIDNVTSEIYHVEVRPTEGGRSAVVASQTGKTLTADGHNARTGVHEYGGAAISIHDGVVYYSNFQDKRVYMSKDGGEPVPITPENSSYRYADFDIHPLRNELIICTLEDHTRPEPINVVNSLCVINTKLSTVTTVVKGADFYTNARFSPDGKYIAWKQWIFPDMPWSGSQVFVAPCEISGDSVSVGEPFLVAGEPRKVCAQEPGWASATKLIFLSDAGGYLNPYQFTFDPSSLRNTAKVSPLFGECISEDFGEAPWRLSSSAWAFVSPTQAVFSSLREGRSRLYIGDIERGTLQEVETPYVYIHFVSGDKRGNVIFLGHPADTVESIARITLEEGSDGHSQPVLSKLKPPNTKGPLYSSELISPAQYIQLQLPPDNRTCHVNFYAPKNPRYSGGMNNENPPVIMDIHGGPSAFAPQALGWQKQFFTSRGFAWIDVNYTGSYGFGREYRESLNGQWGVLDVNDACESLAEMGKRGFIDPERAIICGGSAGGYTTLQAATQRPTVFAAGVPSYGISDVKNLDEISHKFESRYTEGLMGGTYEDIPEVYRERSPIYSALKIRNPLLIFQGDIDPVVPMHQMQNMVETVRKTGGNAELVLFEGEGHGWRKAATVQTVLEKTLSFLEDVLNLNP